MKVAFFPSLQVLSGNPYWRLLAASLRPHGIEVLADNPRTLRLRWLIANRREVQVLHFHYIQDAYAYEHHYARLQWALRFARNLVLARLLGYRVVWTMHNAKPSFPLAPAWVEQLAHLIVAQMSHSVIVHCAAAQRMLAAATYRRRNVYVAPHPHFVGVYSDRISRAEARTALGLSNTHKVLLYLGGIRPNKGIESLLSVFPTIPGEGLRLLVAGDPQRDTNYAASLERLAALDQRILLRAEWIPDDEMQVLYRAADVVVLPFKNVLTSSSLALAMSFGCPVIAPAMGCVPEVVTPDVGWTYEPTNLDGLAAAIRASLNADLAHMGRIARQRIESYTWEHMAAQTLKAYGCIKESA